jgi:hypothetical protein
MADGATRITLAEAKKLHPDEWVVLGDPRIDENDDIIDGILVFHSTDGDLATSKWGEYDGDAALEYFGPVRYRRVTLHGQNAVDKAPSLRK